VFKSSAAEQHPPAAINTMTMKKLLFLLLVFSAHFQMAQAQGQVTETLDPAVQRLMKTFVENNRNKATVKGWRIQILATTDRQRVENALLQFRQFYPNLTADWIHAKPYYKLRAGAFTSRSDALATLYVVKTDYPAAYLVQDNNIKAEELLW